MVMQHTRNREFAGSGAAANRIGGLKHLNINPMRGKPNSRSQSIWPGSYNDGGRHLFTLKRYDVCSPFGTDLLVVAHEK